MGGLTKQQTHSLAYIRVALKPSNPVRPNLQLCWVQPRKTNSCTLEDIKSSVTINNSKQNNNQTL